MITKVSHFAAVPEVKLTEGINANELIPPQDGSMSSHKIWVPPNVSYPPHIHPAPHIIVIVEGGGQGEIGNEKFLLETGDVFYVPGETRHQVGADRRGMVMLAISSGSLRLEDPKRLVVVD